MNLLNEFWLKVGVITAAIATMWAWRQKGISDAVEHEKSETKVTEQAKELIDKDRVIISNAKSNEIEERNGKLPDDELYAGLREYAREDDRLQLGKRNKLNSTRDKQPGPEVGGDAEES